MPHPVDTHVGRKLKQLRSERRMSQTELGNKLGISFQQIQKYEAGSNRISASRLFELGQALNVEVMYFFDDLENDGESGRTDASGLAIARAFAAIENEGTKKRILSFIESISSARI